MAVLGCAADVLRLIAADSWRMEVLRSIHAMALPDCWIGAGFVRASVWDFLHGYERPTALDDVDVIYFDAVKTDGAAYRTRVPSKPRAGQWPRLEIRIPA